MQNDGPTAMNDKTFAMSRRALGAGLLASFAVTPSFAQTTLSPETFGAVGDGLASDGPAIARLVDAINRTPGTERLTVVCRGSYMLRGSPVRPAAPSNSRPAKGRNEGIPPITRDNVFFDAVGAEFSVPPEYAFRRTKRGGDEADIFFMGLQFLGRQCAMRGGLMRGNLDRRSVTRGPKAIGFGGQEYGLVMEGDGWVLEDVVSENWGTDCLLITGPGISRNGIYTGARRNCISVVADRLIPESTPVIIEGGTISRAADWAAQVHNKPGAGIDIEGGRDSQLATVHIRGIRFERNRLKDVQISRDAYRCIVENNVLTNHLTLRPKQRGGHRIIGNTFIGDAHVQMTNAYDGNERVEFAGNACDCSERDFIKTRRSKVKTATNSQDFVLINNTFR